MKFDQFYAYIMKVVLEIRIGYRIMKKGPNIVWVDKDFTLKAHESNLQ